MVIEFPRIKKYTDKEIVIGIQNNKESMARYLYNQCQKYFDQNYKSLFVMDSFLKDDIFQESYVKLWTDIEQHRIHIGEDGNVWRTNKKGEDKQMTAKLVTFQMDIAKNVFRVWQRNQKENMLDDIYSCNTTTEGEGRSWEEKLDSNNGPWENTENIITKDSDIFEQALASDDQRGLMQELVQEAIMNLSETCRDILTMFYYENLSLDDILLRRGENTSKDGLKTGKYKCMKRFEADVRSQFKKYRVKY